MTSESSVLSEIQEIRGKVAAFELEAHRLLGVHESSSSRVFTVDQTRRELNKLSPQQVDLLKDSLSCIEQGIYRAAIVLAWAAFMDNLECKLASDGLVKLKTAKSGWAKYQSMEELREHVPEYQLLEAARDVGVLKKTELKVLVGRLAIRNECAHPSDHLPGANESLGYVSDLLKRMKALESRSL